MNLLMDKMAECLNRTIYKDGLDADYARLTILGVGIGVIIGGAFLVALYIALF